MVIFFNEIQKNCGVAHSTFFISDMAAQYFNEWVGLMGNPHPAKLVCAWHLDMEGGAEEKSGRSRCGRWSLQDASHRNGADNWEQLSELPWWTPWKAGLKTKDFYKYFQKEWVPNKTKWGYCYRVALKINTNMFVEAFHQVFKRLYLGGKYNKCMDTCLVNLIRFIRDKGFDRLIKLTKGKQTYCISNITERHHRSPGMPLQSVQPKEGKWGVLSEGGKDI